MATPEELGDIALGHIGMFLEARQRLIEDSGGTGRGSGLGRSGHFAGEERPRGVERMLDEGGRRKRSELFPGKPVGEGAVGVGGGAEDLGQVELAVPDSLFGPGKRERRQAGRPFERVLAHGNTSRQPVRADSRRGPRGLL